MLKLKEESLDWALKHIEMYGDTDIFPVPFEYEAIRYLWDKGVKALPNGNTLKQYLSNQDMLKWDVRTYRRCLTPKHKYGFRVSTQLDPLDSIIYLSLVYEIGEDIEAKRVSKDKNVSFSCRFDPNEDGRLFDPKVNYNSFLDYCDDKTHILFNDEINYVVVADIADFFPRIYHHPLENAISSSTNKNMHYQALKNLMKNWNYSISYGIPVGQSASRLLAELTLNDIDEGLLSEGIDFCRYVDDFRIFCKTEKEAYKNLSTLANMLFENHGLTLQQHKTRIVPVDEFNTHYLKTDDKKEVDSLSARFGEILDGLGISNPYNELNYHHLPEDIQELIDNLNLEAALQDEIESENPDTRLVNFILKRFEQLNSADIVELVLDNIDKISTSFRQVFQYISELDIDSEKKELISGKMLNVLEDSVIGNLEFHKLWVFHTFAKIEGWGNKDLPILYNEYFDEYSERELILAMGNANQQSWFKTRKRNGMNFSEWTRRAFLFSARCLPGDESTHWYRSMISRLDPLEIAVVEYAKSIR